MKTRNSRLFPSVVIAIALGSQISSAIEFTIVNNSFEDTVIPDGFYTINTIPGWSADGSWFHVANPVDHVFIGTTEGGAGGSGIDGRNAAAVNNFGRILYQNLSETVQANWTYTLTALVGHRTNVPFDDGSINLVAGLSFLGRAFPNPPEGTFVPVTLTYNSPASGDVIGQPLRIELRSAGSIAQGWFDDVHLFGAPSAPGVIPDADSAYVPIPPPWQEWAQNPGPFPGFTPFGGGGPLDAGASVPDASSVAVWFATLLLTFGGMFAAHARMLNRASGIPGLASPF